MNTGLISVIIPTYQRPDKLMRAVRSVLSQTYKNYEILVIDDDHDESLLKTISGFLQTNGIHLYPNKRSKGANGARNTGIKLSKGNYLAFMDDDDEWLPEYLEKQVNCLSNADETYGLVYGGYLLEIKGKWKPIVQKKEGDLLSALITDQFRIGAGSNIFIRRKVIDRVGLWDEELLRQQDLEFLVRVFDQYKVISNQNIVLKIYGHNDPAAKKAFLTREVYFNKVEAYFHKLSNQQKKTLFSNHYRRQANYLVQMGEYRKSMDYWVTAFRNKKTSLRKDGKILLSFLKRLMY